GFVAGRPAKGGTLRSAGDLHEGSDRRRQGAEWAFRRRLLLAGQPTPKRCPDCARGRSDPYQGGAGAYALSPPGERFRRDVLGAMPDIEAMELVSKRTSPASSTRPSAS